MESDPSNLLFHHQTLFNSSTPLNPSEDPHQEAARFLFSYDAVNKVSIPVLFLFGAIGNCLSVTVFCVAPTHRHLSSSYYLSALAISDTGFLINLLAVWLEDMGFQVITRELTCPLVMYLGQVTCFLSVWLTVAFTVERFFAVCYPLTRPTVCTVARAKKTITTLTLLAMLAFSYVWFIARALDFPLANSFEDPNSEEVGGSGNVSKTREGCNFTADTERKSSGGAPCISSFDSGNETGNEILPETIRICYVREEHIYFSSIASHIDSVLTLILPFFIITYLNVRIAICVWKLKDQRENIMAVSKMGLPSTPSGTGGKAKPKTRIARAASNLSNVFNATANPTWKGKSVQSVHNNLNSSEGNGESFGPQLNSPAANQPANRTQTNRTYPPTTSAAEARITKTLLLVSTVFLVLNLPAHAFRAVAYILSLTGSAQVEEVQAGQQWANILFNLNFGVNFLLYCASGRNFRKSLVSILFRRNGKTNSRKDMLRKSTDHTNLHLVSSYQPNKNNHAAHKQPSTNGTREETKISLHTHPKPEDEEDD